MGYNLIQPDTGARKHFRKRYKVADDLTMYLSNVMTRCFHPHIIIKDESGQHWCYTNASSDVFHRLVKRARCEKRSDADGVCYMTYDEYVNPSFRISFISFLERNSRRAYAPEGDAIEKTL